MRKPTPEVIPPAAKDMSPATTTDPIVGTTVETGIEAETLAENGTEAAIKTVVTAEAVMETVVTAGAVVTVATGKATVQRKATEVTARKDATMLTTEDAKVMIVAGETNIAIAVPVLIAVPVSTGVPAMNAVLVMIARVNEIHTLAHLETTVEIVAPAVRDGVTGAEETALTVAHKTADTVIAAAMTAAKEGVTAPTLEIQMGTVVLLPVRTLTALANLTLITSALP